MQPRLEFWYEFASPYSYLSAMRIEALADAAGIALEWRPFLLGPIFREHGWTTSPFVLNRAKGRYMIRDLERLSAARGLDFSLPTTFPANGLTAARLALLASDEGWAGELTRAVYLAEFRDGQDIAQTDVLRDVLIGISRSAESYLACAQEADIKERLKAQTAEASQRGVFGAPTFITASGEMFWGDDRLESALEWALR